MKSLIKQKKPYNLINSVARSPTLQTVLMVEKFLEEYRDLPISFRELEIELPRKVMRSTLQIVLEYLWKSGKIIFGPRGIQWIYVEPEHLQNMMKDVLEV